MCAFSSRAFAIVIAVVMAACGSHSIFAATITGVGLDTTTAGNWRTTTVNKPFYGEWDDVYGSAGYYAFSTGNHNDFAGGAFSPYDLNGLPSWLSLSANAGGSSFRYSGAYQMIDDPTQTPGPVVSDTNAGYSWRGGVPANTLSSIFDLTFGPGTPTDKIRIGLMENSASDSVISFTLNHGANSATQLVGSTLNDGIIRYAFFDIVGATSGDVITISGTLASTPNLGISAISIDVVPEPAIGDCLIPLGLMFIRRTRRSQR
jgi:hypothetical protein